MNLKQKRELVDALLACPTTSNRDTRNSVVKELPDEIRSNIPRSPTDRVDVVNIVTACLDYPNGMPELLEILASFEGNSISMGRVHTTWSHFLNSATAKSSKSPPFTSKKESKARKRYLKTIEADVANRLQSSIHRARFIDIGSQQSLDSTFLPWQYQAYDTPKEFTSFEEAFESFERRILLLGAPGAGKTTTLLHIAQKLIQEAKDDADAPIPLLFNLSKYRGHDETPNRSSWSLFGNKTPESEQKKEQTIEAWLIELTSEYPGVSKEMARSWIEGRHVALLLDGLDEVDDQLLVNLVLKLNTYLHHDLDITVVVCSRIIEYQRLQNYKETRLHLNGAVTLQPLKQRQIDAYLEKAQATALRDALPNDEALYELAQTPLTLSMMTLAYGGLAPTNIPSNLPLVERRRHLFDTYVDRMMQRKARREAGIPFDLNPDRNQPTQYTREQINRYLGWLAVRLSERSQTVFPLHKLHSFLDQYREDEEDEGSWRVTDTAYLLLAVLCTLVIGLSLMPKNLIGLAQAILISGVVAFTPVAYRGLHTVLKKNLSDEGLAYLAILTILAIIGFFSIFALYFGGIVMALVTILPWDIAPIPLGAIILVLIRAGNYLSHSTSKHRVLFVVITLISLFFPIGAITWSGQMNSPEVAIAVSMVAGQALFFTITLYQDDDKDLLVEIFIVLVVIGMIALPTIISITLIATPDWYEVTALTGVSLVALLLSTRQAAIILGITIGVVFSSFVAGPSGAVLGPLLLSPLLLGLVFLFNSISEKYLVNSILRIILAISGSIRLNYDAFLNYTVETLLLKKVGTEYEFVHRLLRDHFATRELIPLLSEENTQKKLQVIQKVSLQSESAIDILAVLFTDPDARIRQEAVVGLSRIATPEAVQLMEKALHDSDTRVRLAVVTNANKLTFDDAHKLFNIALHDKDLNVRQEAIYQRNPL